MADPAVSCGGCGRPLTGEALFGSRCVPCEGCGTRSRAVVYPAFFTARVQGAQARSRSSEDASCFYHPDKRAEVPCDACGRFLCSLCDIEVGVRHWCSACLQASAQKPGAALETERLLHDEITLALAVLPFTMAFWFVAPVTAPLAIYRALRYWRQPASLVRTSRWRLVVAALLGLAEIALMIALVVLLRSRG